MSLKIEQSAIFFKIHSPFTYAEMFATSYLLFTFITTLHNEKVREEGIVWGDYGQWTMQCVECNSLIKFGNNV